MDKVPKTQYLKWFYQWFTTIRELTKTIDCLITEHAVKLRQAIGTCKYHYTIKDV